MYGFAGNDTLTGGLGADSMLGGDGDDIIVVNGGASDILLHGGNEALGDTLRLDASFNDTSDGQIADIEFVNITAAGTYDLAQQTETLVITGSAGANTIIAGSGADTIQGFVGADNVDGGGGTDILNLNAGTSADLNAASDAQLQNVEHVFLQTAATVNLFNQTEGFRITGSLGIDSMSGGGGDDLIIGDQADSLFDGNGGNDTLQLAANFDDASDAQITEIENITLTAAATLVLSQQTEAFNITGSGGNDTITGGAGGELDQCRRRQRHYRRFQQRRVAGGRRSHHRRYAPAGRFVQRHRRCADQRHRVRVDHERGNLRSRTADGRLYDYGLRERSTRLRLVPVTTRLSAPSTIRCSMAVAATIRSTSVPASRALAMPRSPISRRSC